MHFPKCVQLLRLSVCYVCIYIYIHMCVCVTNRSGSICLPIEMTRLLYERVIARKYEFHREFLAELTPMRRNVIGLFLPPLSVTAAKSMGRNKVWLGAVSAAFK